MKLKRSKKQKARRVRYGMVKVKSGEKFCWESHENKHGYSLGFAVGKRTIWLKNTRFASPKDIERALGATILFVHTKNSKNVKNV